MDTQHKALRDYLREHATFTVQAEQDDIPVRGNAMASGDDAVDKACEDDIIERLGYTVWAWASVRVRASYRGLHGDDYLGCCSYDSEADFTQPGGYYDDMRETALDRLVEAVVDVGKDVASYLV